jgi:hypothetical protein
MVVGAHLSSVVVAVSRLLESKKHGGMAIVHPAETEFLDGSL